MKALLSILMLGIYTTLISQNIGIGTTNPIATLMLNSNFNPQLHIRQTNTADYSRIRLQTGTGRYWDIAGYNDGSAISNERLNFFNSQTGDLLTITGSGNIGIGTTNPITPLSFPALLGRKITLFPGGAGPVGMGVYNNEFRFHTDYDLADITFGYENYAGTFTERFRFKGNGAFVINGSAGTQGKALTSGGANAAPTWTSPGRYGALEQSNSLNNITPTTEIDIPNLTTTINLPVSSQVAIYFTVSYSSEFCSTCDATSAGFRLYRIVSGNPQQITNTFLSSGNQYPYLVNTSTFGPTIVNLPAGTHTIKVTFQNGNSTLAANCFNSKLAWQIFPD